MILQSRRFTAISNSCVRVEYAPSGQFSSQQSIVAGGEWQEIDFVSVEEEGPWTVLKTSELEVRARDHSDPFNRLNLEIRWIAAGMVQFWRPGDRDHQNFGGPVRSLDRYGGAECRIEGVHAAGMEPPDFFGRNWVAWVQDEVDGAYAELHPKAPAKPPTGHWGRIARASGPAMDVIGRTKNIFREALRFPAGFLSDSGYFFLNDSESSVWSEHGALVERRNPGAQDWYFFAYGQDFAKGLADFRRVCGPVPLPRRRSLGIQFCRWPAFRPEEVEAIVADFARAGHPLTTIHIDMEWHKEGWGHWEFDPSFIPDPVAFFRRCHELGLDILLNDHPLDIREDDVHFAAYLREAGSRVEVRPREYKGRTVQMAAVDIADPKQLAALRNVCHQPIWEMGLDGWWNDGTRGELPTTEGQLIGNAAFFEDSRREGRRGLLLARYGGWGSHRYGMTFTGDTTCDYEVLRLQCEYNIRAAGVGLSWISHDIGGFSAEEGTLRKNEHGAPCIDARLYLRWLEFGVFNPILRFHSAPWSGSRLPSDYEGQLGEACRRWLQIRHSLVPYLVTCAHETHATGMPITRGLFLQHPADPAARRFDEYYFGPSILVAPVLEDTATREVYLPGPAVGGPIHWWDFLHGTRVEAGLFHREVALEEVPVYVPEGTILPWIDLGKAVTSSQVEELVLRIYPGAEGGADLVEDDGVSEQSLICRSHFHLTASAGEWLLQARVSEGTPLGLSRRLHLDIPEASGLRGAVWQDQFLPARPSPMPGWLRISLPEIKRAENWSILLR